MKNLREQTVASLAATAKKLEVARVKFEAARDKMVGLIDERKTLLAALDAFDRRPASTPFVYVPNAPTVSVDASTVTPAPGMPAGYTMGELNGLPVIIEPGMKIGKNSFGEDCLVPVNAPDAIPMQAIPERDPAKPQAAEVEAGDLYSPGDMDMLADHLKGQLRG